MTIRRRPLIALSVAHHTSSPGACAPDGSYCEYAWSLRLCQAVEASIGDRADVCVVDRSLRATIDWVCRVRPDLTIEPHLNAAAGGQHRDGALLIYWGASRTSEAVVRRLSPGLATVRSIGGWDGRVARWALPRDGVRLGLITDTPSPCVITESGWIDRQDQADWLWRPSTIAQLARVHADAAVMALHDIGRYG